MMMSLVSFLIYYPVIEFRWDIVNSLASCNNLDNGFIYFTNITFNQHWFTENPLRKKDL